MSDLVRAAGAVLWRPAPDGVEVCLVHRPAYDDWSLPKGKLDDDEHPLAAALREVTEETGLRGAPEVRLPDVSYTLPRGDPKTVSYWAMRLTGAAPVPIVDPAEVDRIDWLTPDRAVRRLSYSAEAELVTRVAELPPITALTVLVRHAHAGERKSWPGNDALRPLDEVGQRQAIGLAGLLTAFAPRRLVAATPLRCRQTLEPLADVLGLPIVSDAAFAEPDELDETPTRVAVALARLAELRDGERAAICSQGKLMPPLLAALAGTDEPETYKTPKGDGWVLSWSGATPAAMSRL